MKNRRSFLKRGFLIVSATVLGKSLFAREKAEPVFPGIIYSEKHPGKWEGKSGSHAPKVKLNGSSVNLVTQHGMSETHYIVRHTLVTPEGDVLGEKTFYPSDEIASSSFQLPDGYSGSLYATSFCNKHDFWITEFSV